MPSLHSSLQKVGLQATVIEGGSGEGGCSWGCWVLLGCWAVLDACSVMLCSLGLMQACDCGIATSCVIAAVQAMHLASLYSETRTGCPADWVLPVLSVWAVVCHQAGGQTGNLSTCCQLLPARAVPCATYRSSCSLMMHLPWQLVTPTTTC